MNSKGIGIALAVLTVLVIATIFAYREPASVTPTVTDPWQRLPKDRIDRITIHRASAPAAEQEMEFEKVNGAWRMTRPGQGPTEPRAIEDLLDRFAEMHVTSIAGHNTSSYDDFEVDDAHATRVTLKTGSSVVMDVFVGASLDSGTAVRVPGKTEVFRVGVSISSMLSRSPRDWRDRDITQVSRDTIRAVEWVGPRGTFRFTRNGDTWSPASGTNIPRLDTAKVNALVDTVTNLRASDFAASDATTGITPESPRVTIETEVDGSSARITLRVGNNSGDQQAFVQREGNDVVFIISSTQADAIKPTLEAFQAPLPSDGGADAAVDASAPTTAMNLPSSIPTPGGGEVPPAVMEQLRRQLQQQAAAR